MNKELCTKKTHFGNPKFNQNMYPTCVYYGRVKQRCTLTFCYRGVKEKGTKA